MADIVASAPVAVLYRPKLCQASLGEILHGLLHPFHCLDCSLLLLHGLDGECNVCVEGKNFIDFQSEAFARTLLLLSLLVLKCVVN